MVFSTVPPWYEEAVVDENMLSQASKANLKRIKASLFFVLAGAFLRMCCGDFNIFLELVIFLVGALTLKNEPMFEKLHKVVENSVLKILFPDVGLRLLLPFFPVCFVFGCFHLITFLSLPMASFDKWAYMLTSLGSLIAGTCAFLIHKEINSEAVAQGKFPGPSTYAPAVMVQPLLPEEGLESASGGRPWQGLGSVPAGPGAEGA